MPGRFAHRAGNPIRRARHQMRQEIIQFAFFGGDRVSLSPATRRRLLGRRPPFVGEHHHRLGQVQRHELRVQSETDQAVAHWPCRRCPAPRAPAQTARRPADRGAHHPQFRAPPRAVSSGLTICRGRGQVANTRFRSATASARSHEDSPHPACRCGAGSGRARPLLRPAIPRRDDAKKNPPLPIARATAPIFSANCGRTNTPPGSCSIGKVPRRRRDRSCTRYASGAHVGCLSPGPSSEQSREDRRCHCVASASGGILAACAPPRARRLRPRCPRSHPPLNHQSAHVQQPSACPPARTPACHASPASAASASSCSPASARAYSDRPQRLHDRRRHLAVAAHASMPPARDTTGPVLARLDQPRIGKIERRAIMRAHSSRRTASPGAFLSASRTLQQITERLRHFFAIDQQHALCSHTGRTATGKAQQDCANSFSWCGRSGPRRRHEYRTSRRDASSIALHSICQPGRPRPHGLSQPGRSGPEGFHSKNPRIALIGRHIHPGAGDPARRAYGRERCRIGVGGKENSTCPRPHKRAHPQSAARSMRDHLAPDASVARGSISGGSAFSAPILMKPAVVPR